MARTASLWLYLSVTPRWRTQLVGRNSARSPLLRLVRVRSGLLPTQFLVEAEQKRVRMDITKEVARFALENTRDPELAAALVDHFGLSMLNTDPRVSMPPQWVLAQQRKSVKFAAWAVEHCNDPATLALIYNKFAKRRGVRLALARNASTHKRVSKSIVEAAKVSGDSELIWEVNGRSRVGLLDARELVDQLEGMDLSSVECTRLIDKALIGGRYIDRSLLLSELGWHEEVRQVVLDRVVELSCQLPARQRRPGLDPGYVLSMDGLSDEQFSRVVTRFVADWSPQKALSELGLEWPATRGRVELVLAMTDPDGEPTELPAHVMSMFTGPDDDLIDRVLGRMTVEELKYYTAGQWGLDSGRSSCFLPDRERLAWIAERCQALDGAYGLHSWQQEVQWTLGRTHLPVSYRRLLVDVVPGAHVLGIEHSEVADHVFSRLAEAAGGDVILALSQLSAHPEASLDALCAVLRGLSAGARNDTRRATPS